MQDKLIEIRQWAKDKIASGAEPPWAWYQYMKLVETVDAILGANDYVTTENSPQSQDTQGAHLRLVGATDQQDSAPRRPSGVPVPMPM